MDSKNLAKAKDGDMGALKKVLLCMKQTKTKEVIYNTTGNKDTLCGHVQCLDVLLDKLFE